MSNHFSAANLKYPGDDARLDLTDLFVFSSPAAPGTTVLILDSNPFMTGAEGGLHGFAWTGQDTFAGKNILSIALEVPNGKAGSQGLPPHDDLLTEFPFLGLPNS